MTPSAVTGASHALANGAEVLSTRAFDQTSSPSLSDSVMADSMRRLRSRCAFSPKVPGSRLYVVAFVIVIVKVDGSVRWMSVAATPLQRWPGERCPAVQPNGGWFLVFLQRVARKASEVIFA